MLVLLNMSIWPEVSCARSWQCSWKEPWLGPNLGEWQPVFFQWQCSWREPWWGSQIEVGTHEVHMRACY